MDERLVALAIPFFLVMMGLELLLTRKNPDRRYRFADSATNLACGIGQQVLEPFMRGASLVAYVWLYEHARVATIPASSIAGWVVLVIGVDFFYYVFHRASHRVGIFWASHVVHHQSEEYNLSVALRQSWVEIILAWVFYLPLAIAGFAPLAFLAVSTLNTLYQFWIHTRAVDRCPRWFEAVFNTPSHHRVHHGVNPKYVDKNYAGMLIVWDRLLGTFQAEEEEPVYGTVKPLASYNPLWANATYWIEMAQLAKAATRLRDKAYVWIAPPEWRPRELSNGLGYVVVPEASRASQVKYDPRAPRAILAYVAWELVLVVASVMAILMFAERAPAATLAATSALILFELVAWGGLLEGRAWGVPIAIARAFLTALAMAWFFGATLPTWIALAGALVASAWLVRFRPRSLAIEEQVRGVALGG